MAAGVFFLLKRTCASAIAVAIGFVLAVVMIFSPAQFELWLFASGFPSFLPALFLVAALGSLHTRWPTGAKYTACALLATASSFTLPHGLLLWALSFPVLLLARRTSWPLFWLVIWCATAGVCAALYFHGYNKPAYLPAFAPAVAAGDYLRFLLIFLGGGLAYTSASRPATAALCYGIAQVALLLIACGFLAARWRELRWKALPWLALCGYAIGSAVLATMGRVGYGPEYALASRYVPFSLYIGVGLVGLTALLSTTLVTISVRTRALVCGALMLAFLLPYRACAANTTYFLHAAAANNRLAKGALLFSQVLDTRKVIQRLIYPPNPNLPISLGAELDRLHLLSPPLLRTTKIVELPQSGGPAGVLEGIERAENTMWKAHGWAVIPGRHRPAGCVVLAYETTPGDAIAFAQCDVLEPRFDVVRRTKESEHYWAGWSATFAQTAVPEGATITAWAVDTAAPRLFRLAGEARLER
jgi:hypothetical protein